MAIIQSSNFMAGTKVTIYLLKADGSIDDSATPIEATVFANGNLVRNVPFNNGESFLLVGTDKQGIAYRTNLTVTDTIRPDKPLFSAQDDIGVVQGAIQPNTTTDDNQPTFSGTSKEIGGIVKIFDQGVEIGSATVQPDGTWSFTPTTPLVDGSHVITIQQIDPKGNISVLSDPLTFVVDTQPVKIEILKALDDVGLNQSDLANHAITDDATPTLVGTGLVNAVVHISENGTEIGSTTVDASGNWVFELPAQMDGTHQYTATITNTAGVSGSTQFTLTIDTFAPTTTATLTGITDDSGTVGDYITNDPSLILNGIITGTVEPTDKVQVSIDGGATWQDATIDPINNTWILDHTAQPLTDGQHEVVVRVIDEAGNIGPLSTPQVITIDTETPTAQANITGITEDTGIANDFMTADTTLVIHGTVTGALAIDEKVQVSIDGGAWVEATLDRVNNTWTLDNTANPLSEGSHQVETRIIDAAGNTTAAVAEDIVIDTTKPVDGLITISGITDDTGVVGDYITNDKSLMVNGLVLQPIASDERVQVSFDDGLTWHDTVLDRVQGTWSYDNTANELSEGTHTLKAQVIDLAGNVSSPVHQIIEIDTTISPPDSGHLTFDAITEDTGTVGDFNTGDNTLILSGQFQGAADERVQVSLDGGTTWLDATVDSVTNTWSYDNTANQLADGSYTFSARIVDIAGNVTSSVSQTIVINTAPLEAGTIKFTAITDDTGLPADFKTSDQTLVISGEIIKPLNTDERVQVSLNGGTTWVDATLDRAAGTWSYDNTQNQLVDGTYRLEARVINTVGITSPVITQTVVVDSAVPTAIAEIIGITTDTGTVGDYVTSDDTLTINGRILNTLATGETVQVSIDGGMHWKDAVVNSVTHTWSLDDKFYDGTYYVQARVVDEAGNASAVSNKTVVVDTQASNVISTLTGISDDTGVVGDFSTSDNSLELTGSLSAPLEIGDKVQISLNGGKTWLEATVDSATNTWSYDNTDNPLADGTYKFQTRVIDQAGNVGQVTAQDIVIDTRAPLTSAVFTGITEDTGTTGDYITNDNALVFKGKINGGSLAAGDTVQLSLDGGTTWVEAVIDPATRTWSYDNTANPLTDGTHTLLTRVVDKSGNSGVESSQDIQIDTSMPVATSSLTSITTDTGVLGDYVTSDNTLIFKGQVDGVLAADERVQISLDGGATWLETTLDRVTNKWNYNNTINELDDGSYTVQSRVIDTAGNVGTVSTQTVVVDSSISTATATLTTVSDDTGTVGDFITQDNSLLFQGNITGALAADESVQISLDGGRNWSEVTLDRVANTWLFDHTSTPLVNGTYNVQVRVIDTANNVGQLTSQSVVINNLPSTASVEFTSITEDSGIVGDYITNDNSLVLHGKILNNLAATDYIEISLDNGATWQQAVVDRTNHTWSYDNTANPLVDGAYTFQARVVNVAGVAGSASTVDVQIDTQAPYSSTLAKLTTITDDTGVIDDFVTSDNTLLLNGEITGQLEPTDKVLISLNGGKTWSEATVDYTNKTWGFDNTANALADGTYKVQVRVVDLAGNQGDISEHDVVVDSRPPVASALFSSITEDTGVAGDYQTKDNTLVFNGTIIGDVAANDAVEVSLDGGTTWIKAVLDPIAKTWTLDHSATTLVDGTYTLAARVVDQAGNTGPIATQKLVIDTSVPTATSEFTSITEDTGTVGDFQTNDQTLIISGKVTGILATDDQVQLSLDGGQTWLNVTVDSATNTWTYNNTANSLAEGTYQFQTRVVDKVLNGDVTDTQQVVIDLTPPSTSLTLAFTGISDDTGIAGDYKTSDTTLIINGKIESGTLAANDHVEVSVDGGNTWTTVQVDPVSQTWSLDNTANTLSSGTHQFIARVVDQVGNVGHQIIQQVTIVTEPPKATADLTLITDDSGVAGDFVTNDPSLVFSGNITGALDSDETVQVSLDGGLSWLTATTDPTGTSWNLDHATTDLVDGKYTVITRVIDSTGTAGVENTQEIVIDTAPPTATTTLSGISQDSGQAGDFITNDNTLIFNGTVVGNLAADERVQISLDGGATWTDATLDRPANMWMLDNTTATLTDGTYSVVSRVIDQAGNIGASSTPQNIIIDTALPSSLASITSISEDTGVNTSDFVTKDATLIIHGKASTALASNEKVQISFDNGANWVDATSKADGTWSYDNTAQTLQDGTYTVQARVIDTAGNSSAVVTQNFTVDTKVPTALSDLDLKDDVGAIQGTIPEQGVTDDTRPEFTGKAPADAAYVNIYDNGNLIGTATVQADGTWSFTPTLPLGAGPHSLTAAPVDVAGNEGAVTTPWTFDLLGAPPPAPAITNVVDNVAGGLFNQTIPKDGLTNDKTPTISGTGQVGSTIHVYSDGVEVANTVVKTDGTWSVEVADLGVDGAKAIKAQAVDAAGQLSPFTGDYVIHLDTAAPSKPDLAAVDNVGQVVGPITNGSVTDDGTPTFSGNGEAGSTITLTDNGTVIGTATVQPDGTWTFTPTVELGDGPHNVVITQTDPAGNTSAPSDALSFDVDKSAVNITISATDNKAPVIGPIADGGVTNDDTPVLSGTTKAGTIVAITDKSGNALGSVTADANGNWSLEVPTQSNGAQTYTATATLTNGNTATATIGFTIDTIKPTGLTLETVSDDVGLVQGLLKSGDRSDDTTPTVGGKAEANSIVSIYENGLLVGSTTAKADGTWSYTIPAPGLTEGTHALTATQTDQAGNVSDPTAAFNIVIDVTAPISTAVITAISEDRGIAGDFITNDKTLVISGQVNGTLEIGDKVQVSLDGGITWLDAVTNTNGTWTLDRTGSPFTDGTYKFESRVIDAAGIPGVATAQNVKIDSVLTPNTAISMTGYEDKGVSSTDFYSNDTQFTLNVTG
ncbi:Ig-like domain-containing protein, partial [Acinetobacter rongchengensis]